MLIWEKSWIFLRKSSKRMSKFLKFWNRWTKRILFNKFPFRPQWSSTNKTWVCLRITTSQIPNWTLYPSSLSWTNRLQTMSESLLLLCRTEIPNLTPWCFPSRWKRLSRMRGRFYSTWVLNNSRGELPKFCRPQTRPLGRTGGTQN